jgi:carboxyl-terminal processing protease
MISQLIQGYLLRIYDSKYRFCVIWLLASVLLTGWCERADGISKGTPVPRPRPRPTAKTSFRETPEAKTVIASACEKILTGDFGTAGRIVEDASISESKGLEQLAVIIDEYEAIKARRKASKNNAYVEQVDELEEIQQKNRPEDVNDIAGVFVPIIKAAQHADKNEKKALLEEPFVKQMIEKALQAGRRYEAQGDWVNAYANCYYWLKALDEDNAEYKNHADELYEKVKIEMSLKDNSCETSAERHEGIKPEMFLRAVKALDLNYVSIVDYGEMTKKALKRCRLLGQVLAKADDELAYQVDAQKAAKWSAGLDAIQKVPAGSLVTVTKDRFLKVFEEILALNSVTIQIPQEAVVAQFVEAALEALDPYTILIWPWQVRDFEKNITQKFTGIGVQISKATGILKVVSLIPNTPAYSSGLDADDVILAVEGEPTDNMTIYCAVSKITGPKGTKVTLTVKHADSDEVEDITIRRDSIIVPTIRGWQRAQEGKWRYMIEPANDIGYIRITNFTETTAPDMKKILKGLEGRGLNGLIIDLRDNTGGYLSASAAVADMFITEGLIVKSQPRWGISTWEEAHKKGTHPRYPLVVLINERSASASEIVAGALHDPKYKRATIVGQRSYGKGSVQTITQFPGDGSQFRYTMAYYHLPSDQRVKNRYVMEKKGRKDWGIAPDVQVEVKPRTEEYQKMIEVQAANEVLAKTDRNGGSKSLKRYSLAETIEADPQLAIGLLVLKSKMIQVGRVLDLPVTTSADAKTRLSAGS